MIRLGLVRHGHTAWNRAGRIQGRTDIPLDDEARAQLSDLCLPDNWMHAQIASSPLSRALETGRLITGSEPVKEPALMEMDWGDWEGLKGVDLRADPASGFKDIEDWGWAFRPPGGECPSDLRARLEPWANGLTQDTIAICHIGVMRVLLAIAAGWNFVGPAPFQVKRNRIFEIQVENDGWHLVDPQRLVRRP